MGEDANTLAGRYLTTHRDALFCRQSNSDGGMARKQKGLNKEEVRGRVEQVVDACQSYPDFAHFFSDLLDASGTTVRHLLNNTRRRLADVCPWPQARRQEGQDPRSLDSGPDDNSP